MPHSSVGGPPSLSLCSRWSWLVVVAEGRTCPGRPAGLGQPVRQPRRSSDAGVGRARVEAGPRVQAGPVAVRRGQMVSARRARWTLYSLCIWCRVCLLLPPPLPPPSPPLLPTFHPSPTFCISVRPRPSVPSLLPLSPPRQVGGVNPRLFVSPSLRPFPPCSSLPPSHFPNSLSLACIFRSKSSRSCTCPPPHPPPAATRGRISPRRRCPAPRTADVWVRCAFALPREKGPAPEPETPFRPGRFRAGSEPVPGWFRADSVPIPGRFRAGSGPASGLTVAACPHRPPRTNFPGSRR